MTEVEKIARGKSREKIVFGGREYTRFLLFPKAVRDGSCRCIACGQIDEPEVHDNDICLALRQYLQEQSQ